MSKEIHKKNRIEEFFRKDSGKKSTFSELFKGTEENIDQMTELSDTEIKLINTLHLNDVYLKKMGIGSLFEDYYNKFMRLQVSKNRQSRSEFVQAHQAEQQKEKNKTTFQLMQP